MVYKYTEDIILATRRTMFILGSFLSILLVVQGAKFPKEWTACKKSDPRMNECLKNAIQVALTDLTNGKPSLGVTPLDPLHFHKINIEQGTGPVSIKLEFRELDAIGIKHIKIKSVKNDWKVMEVDVDLPANLTLDGQYKIDGKVLVLPIKGDGHCNLVLNGVFGKAILKFSKFDKSGKKYYRLDNLDFTFDSNRITIKLDNLFNGDKTLGDNMNAFLNENWKELLKELRPAVAKAFGAAFKEIGNRVLSKIEADAISPP